MSVYDEIPPGSPMPYTFDPQPGDVLVIGGTLATSDVILRELKGDNISKEEYDTSLYNLADAINKITRGDSNLKTAAYVDKQTSLSDSTANRALLTGGGGLLGDALVSNDWNALTKTGFYRNSVTTATGIPEAVNNMSLIHHNISATVANQVAFSPSTTLPYLWRRAKVGGTWGRWFRITLSDKKNQVSDPVNLVLVENGPGGPDGGEWRYVDNNWNEIATPSKEFFDNHPVWGNIREEIIDGQYMIKIPAFYCAVQDVPSGPFTGKKVWRISATEQLGLTLHSAFYWGGSAINQFWFGKYQACLSGGKLCSVPSVMPAVNRTIVQFGDDALARNTGGVTGFMQQSWWQWSAIQMLYLVENATMDCQAKTGRGRVDTGSAARVDAEDVMQATYRGITGLWGNVWQWSDGITVEAGRIWVWNQSQTLVDSTHTIPDLAGAWRYPNTFTTTSGTGFNLGHCFLAATNQTSLAGATCQDGHYFTTETGRVVPVGGRWDSASSGGLWCVHGSGTASHAHSGIGSRLAKV